jgi:gluconokinase
VVTAQRVRLSISVAFATSLSSLESQPTILILMGVTGSGKTTVGRLLAEDLGWKYFDADDFHPAANIEKMKRGVPLTDIDRQPWLAGLRDLIDDCLNNNRAAVLSCSALKEAYRRSLLLDERVQLVYLRGTPELIGERLRRRIGHYMNPNLLKSQFESLEEPSDVLTIDVSNKPAEIVAVVKEHFQLRPA